MMSGGAHSTSDFPNVLGDEKQLRLPRALQCDVPMRIVRASCQPAFQPELHHLWFIARLEHADDRRRHRCLPIAYTAVLVVHALRQFLLEWVFSYFIFVDVDTQSRTIVGPYEPSRLLNRETFFHHIAPPRHV